MKKHGHETKKLTPYKSLVMMLIIHFFIMFAVMYTMVDTFSHVFINLNQFYMTVMMVAPMAISMLLFMPSMYGNKKVNTIFHVSSALAFVIFLLFMRNQSFIGDKQFLRSMIPHHSGAILMCEESPISDPEIIKLCEQIIESQKREIEQMEVILKRL